HRPEEGPLILRVACDELPSLLDEAIAEGLVDVLMDDDALNADAALTGLIERAEDDALHGIVEIPVAVDDDGRGATRLEEDPLLPRSALEVPADGGRAGEAEELQALIRREEIGAIPPAGEDRKGAFGEIGLREHLADDERAERSAARGLEHEGAADRDRGRDLVRGEVEREVERRDERAGSDRDALPESPVAAGARGDVEGQHLAVHTDGLARRGPKGVDQAADLAAAIADRLPGLDRQKQGQLLATLVEAARAVLEHGLALIRGESAHGLGSLDGASDRLVDRAFVGERNARHDFARILVGDLEIAIGSVGAV